MKPAENIIVVPRTEIEGNFEVVQELNTVSESILWHDIADNEALRYLAKEAFDNYVSYMQTNGFVYTTKPFAMRIENELVVQFKFVGHILRRKA